MACEVPVISSNAGGLPEVNIHGQTGFLSDVGNVEEMANYAIQILSNEDVLNRFRENALAQPSGLTLPTSCPSTNSITKTSVNDDDITVTTYRGLSPLLPDATGNGYMPGASNSICASARTSSPASRVRSSTAC